MTDETKVEWPKWLFRRGADGQPEAVLFETADDVPDDDWKEHPRDCVDPLDHDNDGSKGGSKPEAEDPDAAEKAAIRAEFDALGVEQPHPRTGLAKLRLAIEAVRAAKAGA